MLAICAKKDPQRLTLREQIGEPGADGFEPEAFVVMAPITPPMRRRAARATQRLLGDVELTDIDVDRLIDASEVGAKELVRLGILEWGGIGGPTGDEELQLSPDRDTRFATANDAERPTGTIDMLLDDEEIFDKIATLYVRPDAMRRAEKNGLSVSPNGTGEAAKQASNTAGSPVNRKAKRTAAKSARTANTRSRAKPAKRSGRA